MSLVHYIILHGFTNSADNFATCAIAGVGERLKILSATFMSVSGHAGVRSNEKRIYYHSGRMKM